MHNYGREVPNFSEDIGLLANTQLPSETMTDGYILGAEILETQERFQELGRPMADRYWEEAVVPKFTALGYEGSNFIDLIDQAKDNLLEWRKIFDEFDRRYPTYGEHEEPIKPYTIYELPGNSRRQEHVNQMKSLLHILEALENNEVPEYQKGIVEAVVDCAQRLLLQSNMEITDLSKQITDEDRDLLFTNKEVIDWVKNYINNLISTLDT